MKKSTKSTKSRQMKGRALLFFSFTFVFWFCTACAPDSDVINDASRVVKKACAGDGDGARLNELGEAGANYALICSGTLDTTPPEVSINPPPGMYGASTNLVFAVNERSTIYYTTDGTIPTVNSDVYDSKKGIMVTANMSLKYFAVDEAGMTSAQTTVEYTIDSTVPTIELLDYTPYMTTNTDDAYLSDDAIRKLKILFRWRKFEKDTNGKDTTEPLVGIGRAALAGSSAQDYTEDAGTHTPQFQLEFGGIDVTGSGTIITAGTTALRVNDESDESWGSASDRPFIEGAPILPGGTYLIEVDGSVLRNTTSFRDGRNKMILFLTNNVGSVGIIGAGETDNNFKAHKDNFRPAIDFSVAPGIYPAAQDVFLFPSNERSPSGKLGELYYTTDGSNPKLAPNYGEEANVVGASIERNEIVVSAADANKIISFYMQSNKGSVPGSPNYLTPTSMKYNKIVYDYPNETTEYSIISIKPHTNTGQRILVLMSNLPSLAQSGKKLLLRTGNCASAGVTNRPGLGQRCLVRDFVDDEVTTRDGVRKQVDRVNNSIKIEPYYVEFSDGSITVSADGSTITVPNAVGDHFHAAGTNDTLHIRHAKMNDATDDQMQEYHTEYSIERRVIAPSSATTLTIEPPLPASFGNASFEYCNEAL